MRNARLASWVALSSIGLLAGVACGDSTTGSTTSSSSSSSGGGASTTSSTASTGTGTGGSGGGVGGSAGIQIPALSAPVQAVYDEFGLLHLTCGTDNDCYAALGYFHAQNRFFFMDFVRNVVRGKLGNLVKAGDTVLKQDYANRLFFSTPTGTPLEDALYSSASDDVKGYMDSYTKGVNAWIGDMRAGRNGATLTKEYDFALIVKANIRDWEAADSAAVGLYVLNELSNNSASEIAMASNAPKFDPAFAADLFTPKPVFDAFSASSIEKGFQSTQASFDKETMDRLRPLHGLFDDARATMSLVGSGMPYKHPGEEGSNNWVVGPTLSKTGNSLLANDPHLLLSNPSIWFAAELDAKSSGTGTYHVAGSTFPGLPSVMIGHNEKVGWGVTTAYYDLTDEYLEKISADGKQVTFNGKQVDVISKDVSFDNAVTGKPVIHTLKWVPQHGPIVSEDDVAGTALTIKWVGHQAGTDLDAFFRIAKSASVDEAKSALASASSANQNFVVIDTEKHFGWFPYSQVPARDWASASLPPWLPLPGQGSAEWNGSVPLSKLPQAEDPVGGFIATANADISGASIDGDILNDNQPALQAWSKADGTRLQRIQDLIVANGNNNTVATMQSMQGDTVSLYGQFTVPLILAAEEGQTLTANQQAIVDALKDWKYTCPTGLDGSDPVAAGKSTDKDESSESIGCTAFHTTFYAIVQAAVGDEIAKAGVDVSADKWDMLLVARALHKPSDVASGDLLWDDVTTPAITETRTDILRKAVTVAGDVLQGSLGGSDEWRWGRVHTLSLRSIYDNFNITTYNVPAVAAPGGQFTVNVANPLTRTLPTDGTTKPDFAFSSGPSVRMVMEGTADGLTMSFELPGGQDLHTDSPFYNNLLPNWLTNTPINFAFGPGAVTNPKETFTVHPSK